MNRHWLAGIGFALLVSTAPAMAADDRADDLGYAAIQKGDWADAEAQLRAGLAAEPADSSRLLNLAYVLQNLGRRDEAMAVYRQVLTLERDPLVAVGPDTKVRPARAKLVAKKGMASLDTK